jgi:hypothetical protein
LSEAGIDADSMISPPQRRPAADARCDWGSVDAALTVDEVGAERLTDVLAGCRRT